MVVVWYIPISLFSGALPFLDWDYGLFNTFFTTLPLLYIATYDTDLPAAALQANPSLYKRGPSHYSFNATVFAGWCLVGVWHSIVAYTFAFEIFADGGVYYAGHYTDPSIYMHTST